MMFGIPENVRQRAIVFYYQFIFSPQQEIYTHTHTHTQRTPQDQTERVADKCKLHKGQQLPWQ